MQSFSQLLRKYLAASGVKQAHVAASAHISTNYLNRLLSGNRRPSEAVVQSLAQALHLSAEQVGELCTTAGYLPPPTLLLMHQQEQKDQSPALHEPNSSYHLVQQLYHLLQEIPEPLRPVFEEEVKHWFGYARYKYVLGGGVHLLDLHLKPAHVALPTDTSALRHQTYLDQIAQIIGELSVEDKELADESLTPEDTLSIIDQLIGDILAGEVSSSTYQPHLIAQVFNMLREGAPWEIRRRIAEALPSLCRLDVPGTEQLMEALRVDTDELRGVDIRRRVIEALPVLFETSPASLSMIVRFLQPRYGDDIYVALATVEACGDIQTKAMSLVETEHTASAEPELITVIQQYQSEIAYIQRRLITSWEGAEQKSLQFSLALHNLLCAPDTLLISVQEGLRSGEMLLQLVAARYLERVLPTRPLATLELYKLLLHTIPSRNVRRAAAKALPALLHSLKESSLPVRAQTRMIITELATDADVHFRRAVADHAMQIFHIDREFLLILLQHMHKDPDQAIRHRLRPIALRLAEIWLVQYAATATLVDTRVDRTKAIRPFGE